VAETLAISRSSLYYRRKPRASRADRCADEEIITACGEKPAYGYRRVAWWLWRHHGWWSMASGRCVSCENADCLVRQRRFQARGERTGQGGSTDRTRLASDMTKVWPDQCGLGVSGLVDRLLHREIVGWDLSLRCRTKEALARSTAPCWEVFAFGSRGTV